MKRSVCSSDIKKFLASQFTNLGQMNADATSTSSKRQYGLYFVLLQAHRHDFKHLIGTNWLQIQSAMAFKRSQKNNEFEISQLGNGKYG